MNFDSYEFGTKASPPTQNLVAPYNFFPEKYWKTLL